MVGLEIKRGLLIGEMSALRQAAFPLIAAFGGVIIPSTTFFGVTCVPSHSAADAVDVYIATGGTT